MMTFGERLARCSPAPLTVYLYGELGAGKTTLVRGFLGGLQFTGAVKSPTYTLVEPYPTEPPVYHFDLYRLGDPEELEFLGIRDYFEGDTVRLIEWPERGAGVLPAPDVEILIEYAGTGRHLTLRAYTEAARRLITCLNYQ
nr:tRNA (adenosine(37)-N6)-threonylcarbamoyltransferase complex ATPase subunit type 1 TsaE [Thiohalomonas denitrificans]